MKIFRVYVKAVGVIQRVYVKKAVQKCTSRTPKFKLFCDRREDRFVYPEKTNSRIVLNSLRMTIADIYPEG